jgi:hypothetical protein
MANDNVSSEINYTNLVIGGATEVTLTGSSGAFATDTTAIPNSHKIYVRAEFKKQTGGNVLLRFEDIGGINCFPTLVVGIYSPTSYIGTHNSSAGIKYFGFVDTVNTNTLMKNRLAVDLTATFGAGNEPTKDWCDANLSFKS